MSAHKWTEAITSSPAVVSVFDGISESAAQALCEAIEQEIAPLVAQRDDLLAALILARNEFREFFPTVCSPTLAAVEEAIAHAEVRP